MESKTLNLRPNVWLLVILKVIYVVPMHASMLGKWIAKKRIINQTTSHQVDCVCCLIAWEDEIETTNWYNYS